MLPQSFKLHRWRCLLHGLLTRRATGTPNRKRFFARALGVIFHGGFVRKLLAGFLLLIIAFQCIAQSDVKEIALSELVGFGVQVTQMGIKENREQSVNLRFSVPKVDGNNCSISDIELTIEKDGQFIAHNLLSNISESTKEYSSHIVAAKAEGLAFSIGAKYSCKNQITSSIFYKFGDLIEIEKQFKNNGLLSEI
jgi:hypothetical protein